MLKLCIPAVLYGLTGSHFFSGILNSHWIAAVRLNESYDITHFRLPYSLFATAIVAQASSGFCLCGIFGAAKCILPGGYVCENFSTAFYKKDPIHTK